MLHRLIHTDYGIVFDWGATVPTDGTGRYAPGCLFVHTDGSAGSCTYINEGTGTSCDFNALDAGTATTRLDFTGFNPAAANTDGGIIKCGTSSAYITEDTADYKFLSFYLDNGASSGDNRGMYLRLALTGGGGGEAARIYTNVDANAGTAHGAHISIDFAATAGGSECSGLAAAVRGTMHIPNIASWAPTGTYRCGMFEIYSDGTNSDPAGMTQLSVLSLCNSGDGTGKADVDTDAAILDLQGWTSAGDTTKAISSVSLAELPGSSIAFRVRVGSTLYYCPLILASELN